MSFDYDVLVVGSGFGGSVSALRLSEKGYRVGVLEAGRRFGPGDLPQDQLAAAPVPLDAPARDARHPADHPARRRDDPLRLRGRRRLAGLRQHPLRAARRPSTATLSGRTSPTGAPSSPPGTTRPGGCSGSNAVAAETPSDAVMRTVAQRLGVDGHLPPHPGRRLLRHPRRARPRPLLRRRRSRPHRLHPLRRVHDRLPPRRQEQPRPHLPPPRRAARRPDPSRHPGGGDPPAAGRRLRGRRPSVPAPGSATAGARLRAGQVVV